MRGLRFLLVPVAMTVALVGTSVPTSADPAPRPVGSAAAEERWGPLVPVPIPARRVHVWAAAISDLGQIAVAYTAVRHVNLPNDYPGYVIVRSPRGVWSAPHRLNPPVTVLTSVELGFDGRGSLTAFWSSMTNTECCSDEAPPPESTYTVATKSVHRRWTSHLVVGPVQLDDSEQDVVLSVAPSGRAVIGWRQYLESLEQFQFTVRVRKSAEGPWGPARPLSAVSHRTVTGDVAINDHGTAIAAWTAARPWPADTASVQRSTLTRSGAWTAPVTIGTNAADGTVEVASTPDGFTAISWLRPQNWRTIVHLRTAGGIWSRDVVRGAHDELAVGPHRTVVMAKHTVGPNDEIVARAVTWRTNQSDWTTTSLTKRQVNVWVLTTAVDSTGRILVPWRSGLWPQSERGFMATHQMAWATTMLWDWARHTHFTAAAASWNGRAVVIRQTINRWGRTLAVQMRVLRPG
jgi:hypothetical protein